MVTNVPRPTLGPNGFTAPAESAIRTGVFADINGAFGNNLSPAVSTPQGQLADSEAAVIGSNNDLFLKYTNEVDPAFASGRMQDAIGRIYYLFRKPALSTTVICTCTGASGTIIPVGSLGLAADGTIYQSLSLETIPLAGTISIQFAAVTTGPIACPAGTLNTIYRAVPGWDSITNPADGIIGRDVESRSDFEARRALSVSKNATGILGAIRGEVMAVANVLDAYVTENATNAAAVIGGVSLPANSLYVAVVGGTDDDVARAIWIKKSPGCSYYGGNTTITVEDRNGYSIPYPSYDVSFERPASLPIFFDVEIINSSIVPSDATAQVRSAIIAAFNGQDESEIRATIGATVYASRYYQPVALLGAWARINNIKVGITTPGAVDFVNVNINQVPTITSANITVSLV